MSDRARDATTGGVLRVAEVLPQDVGERIVRVPSDLMASLGLVTRDVVELTGRKGTVARVAPLSSGESRAIARLGSIVRQNAGVGLDECVTIRRTVHRPARTIVLAAVEEPLGGLSLKDVATFASQLSGSPVVVGDTVAVSATDLKPGYFEVTSSSPEGPVVVNAKTNVVVADAEHASGHRPRASYEDIGGLDEEVRRIREMVELPIRYPDLFERLGVEAPKGVLLHGPPGTGKTLIARAVANESNARFIHINGPEIVNKLYGESEARLRELFETAQREAPAIIFIDEIDAIAPKRTEVFGDVEKRIVAQLLGLMDGLSSRGQVVVIGATNVPQMVDPALRRPGRFDREVSVNPPDRDGRAAILTIHTRSMQIDQSVSIDDLADTTHGFVGADLAVLCKEAGMSAIRRLLSTARPDATWPHESDLQELRVTSGDFERAFREVEPTALRELFADKPSSTWKDVGGLRAVKRQLAELVELPVRLPASLRAVRHCLPRGVLLTGTSGTGKTLVVHALAGSSDMHFIAVTPATLLSRWHGETERAVHQIFTRARQIAPSILFFDELETLAPARGQGSTLADERLVSQLCMELDRLLGSSHVMVVAATSYPERVDPSLLRPGRFDLVIDLPLPRHQERVAILRIHLDGLPLAADVSLAEIARRTKGRSGAYLAALCRAAMLDALKQQMTESAGTALAELPAIGMAHFESALRRMRTPSSASHPTQGRESRDRT